MKKMSLFACVMVVLAFAACKKDRPAPNTGVAECDEYIVKYEACMDKMPAMARSAAEPAFKAQRDGFKSAASSPESKKMLVTQCKALTDSIKGTCP